MMLYTKFIDRDRDRGSAYAMIAATENLREHKPLNARMEKSIEAIKEAQDRLKTFDGLHRDHLLIFLVL